ncbi:UNVERIFIED_CONTAM: hypothetical protein HDU68_000377 [Siphonaria sp. JEL0065]|nr:hypothetical protein HDU68_000377 [Siphonaria sp. JEL0065]
MEDVGLVNSFGGFAAPPAPILSGPLALETSLTVRVGYEPGTEVDVDGQTKDLADQLRMVPGDHVIIDETFDDGWAVGTNLTTGLAGLFPVTVVKFIPTAAIANNSAAAAAVPPLQPAQALQPTVPLPQQKSPETVDKELEKRKLKEQLDQMQAMMMALQAKLESL